MLQRFDSSGRAAVVIGGTSGIDRAGAAVGHASTATTFATGAILVADGGVRAIGVQQ